MLYTYTSTVQSISANNSVEFNINGIKNCCCIEHTAGTSTITLNSPGIYIISFNADVASAATGEIQFSLYNNDTAVNGAEATTTIAAVDDIYNMSFNAAVKVLPSCPAINNVAQLTVINTGAETAVVSNAALVIRKV